MKKGFTLIELLVVVLIIGVLTAAASPYYEKAIWQSRNTQLKTAARSIVEAQRIFYMKTGKIPANFKTLGVSIPLKIVQTNAGINSNVCQLIVRKGAGVLEGENFIVVMNSGSETEGSSVAVWTKGKYKCNGFMWHVSGAESSMLKCVEARNGTSTIKQGEFCEDLEAGAFLRTQSGWTQFTLPQ